MSATRRERQGERSAALQSLRVALLNGALAAVVWFGAERTWPDDWPEPDRADRDLIVRIATAVRCRQRTAGGAASSGDSAKSGWWSAMVAPVSHHPR